MVGKVNGQSNINPLSVNGKSWNESFVRAAKIVDQKWIHPAPLLTTNILHFDAVFVVVVKATAG